MTRQEYTALVDRCKQLSYEYYVLSKPSVSDAQFDALVNEIELAEAEHPDWTLADSPTQQVGSDLQDNGRRLIAHRTRMLSCQKAQTREAVDKWLKKTTKALGYEPSLVMEWKYDGISCSLVYQDGTLISAATRGDKDRGQDLLSHVRMMPSVPQQITMAGRVEVRGEIVCPKAELSSLGYKDCRTAASALTNQMVPTEEVSRLVFMAWQMDYQGADSLMEGKSMQACRNLGFTADYRSCEVADVTRMLDQYEAEREAYLYPTDGVVIKIDGKASAASLGFTEHHPKGNIAYKFTACKALTKVLRIEVKVAESGRRTPVAYLQPVMIMGREVSKASLYSERKMEELGVTEGCTVEVGLSNDVTPKVYRGVKDNLTTDIQTSEAANVAPDLKHLCNDAANDAAPAAAGDTNTKPNFITDLTLGGAVREDSEPIFETEEQEDEPVSRKLLRSAGYLAAASVAIILVYQTGLIIPLGLIGLGASGLLR
jgi:DNA ligase (NAD+)